MVQHIRRTHSLQRSLGSPPNNKKVGCCNHQPSMCSTWLGHVQLTALPSWKPQHGLTVMWSFYSSQEGGQGLCPPAASCRLPFLVHLHEELLRSEKTSRASPSPPSRKHPKVALVRAISNSNIDKPAVMTLAQRIQAAHCPGARMLLSLTVLSMRKNPKTPLSDEMQMPGVPC